MLGSLVAVLGLVAAVAAVNTGGWRHHGPATVTLHSSAGLMVSPARAAPPGPAAGAPPAVTHPATRPTTLRHLPPLPKPSGALPPVAGLTTVRSVDAIVTLPSTITPAEVQALEHLQGLAAVEEVDTGIVSLAGAPAVTLGVDPGTFRQFTPKVTASQTDLWRYVAGGALVSTYDVAAARGLPLGQEVALTPAGGGLAPTTGWLGALASLGLPGVDLVVSHAYSDRLGLVPDSGLIVSGPSMDPYALDAALTSTLPGSSVELTHPAG